MTTQEIYLEIPLENLFAIYQFKEAVFIKKYRQFIQNWITNKKCFCVKDLGENDILNCEHLQETIDRKFKKEKKELWNISLKLIERANIHTHPNQEWLKRWEL